jgi:ribosomal protein S18 acetylase RimI-like enzyme
MLNLGLSDCALPSGYWLHQGSAVDRARLVKFMQITYTEIAQASAVTHLAATVDHYLSSQTPLWWVSTVNSPPVSSAVGRPLAASANRPCQPIACLWLGTAIDQQQGDRHTQVFLLYVAREHRRRGIGSALMQLAEQWASDRGDRQIGLQVFQANQPALALYQRLGYEVQSLGMTKQLR